MNRNFWILVIGGVLLTCLLIIGMSQAHERIEQGDTVYLDETYDISGVVGWSSELVYAGRWASSLSVDNESILYVVELPTYKSQYFNFTIDRETFGNRLGWWYQYYGEYERQGNLRAFYVRDHRPIITENATIVTNVTAEPTPFHYPLEEKVVANYFAARGDPFTFDYDTKGSVMSVWIFGRTDAIYDARFTDGKAEFSAAAIRNMEEGNYRMWVVLPGKNGQLDTRYTHGTIEYFDPEEFEVFSIPAEELSPQVTYEKVRQEFIRTDDVIAEYTLRISDPYIEITKIDPYYVGNVTVVMRVQGYSNEIAGKPLQFRIDPGLITRVNEKMFSFTGTLNETENPGALRYFDAVFPVFWTNISAGQHEIEVSTPLKAKCNVDFYVYNMPEGQERPQQYIQYIGGYEFKPTPTPEIREVTNETVKTVEVTKYEVKTEVVKEKVDYPVLVGTLAGMALPWTAVVVPSGYLSFTALRAYARGNRRTQKKKEER